MQFRLRSLSRRLPKVATLFRQLVTRAGKPPPASAGREAYTFWVGNVLLPTKSEHRLPLLQTRITKVRMVLLLRLMTECIGRLRAAEERVAAAATAAAAANVDPCGDLY